MPGNTPSASAPARKPRQPQRARHVPQRTCVACKQVRPKRELIRVVRTPQGHVELDPTGKKSGRGAYVCARRGCWELALKKGRLEHEFELHLVPEDRAALAAYAETLPPETDPAPVASTRRKAASSPEAATRA